MYGTPEILAIDDCGEALQVLASQLTVLGTACDAVQGPVKGLSAWHEGQYRLVIMGCHLTGPDAGILARQLRSDEIARNVASSVPIIAWTAAATAEDIRQCIASGISGHLTRPATMDSLRAVVEVWLPAQDVAALAAPVLDERALLAFSGGSRSAEADIFKQLLEESARDRAMLHAAIGAGDAAQSRLIAHRIKGAHLLLGAAPLSAILQRIELAGSRADWAAIRADLPSLEREFQRFGRFVKERSERH